MLNGGKQTTSFDNKFKIGLVARFFSIGTPGRIRTCGLRIRRQEFLSFLTFSKLNIFMKYLCLLNLYFFLFCHIFEIFLKPSFASNIAIHKHTIGLFRYAVKDCWVISL